MAYTNFKSNVWAKAIERERDRYCVGVNLCNRDYETDAADFGQSIIINWTKRPTVRDYQIGTNIAAAETLGDATKTLDIDNLKYVNFLVDDVDELQSNPDIMRSCMMEAAAAIAEDADNFVYGLYEDAGTTITQSALTSENVVECLSEAAQKLYEHNVPMNEDIYLEVSPAVYQKLWLAKVLKTYPNEKEMGSGFVGKFNNFNVYMTNGIAVTSNVHHCYARTKKAIAFVGQMKKMEAYRPEGLFADAVKGLHVYGGIVVRPEELVCLDLTPVSENSTAAEAA